MSGTGPSPFTFSPSLRATPEKSPTHPTSLCSKNRPMALGTRSQKAELARPPWGMMQHESTKPVGSRPPSPQKFPAFTQFPSNLCCFGPVPPPPVDLPVTVRLLPRPAPPSALPLPIRSISMNFNLISIINSIFHILLRTRRPRILESSPFFPSSSSLLPRFPSSSALLFI